MWKWQTVMRGRHNDLFTSGMKTQLSDLFFSSWIQHNPYKCGQPRVGFVFWKKYFAEHTCSFIIQPIYFFSLKVIQKPSLPQHKNTWAHTSNRHTNQELRRSCTHRPPCRLLKRLPLSQAAFPPGIFLSIRPACCESHIILALTQGSVHQPEDLLLQIETRHLCNASCLLPSISILVLPWSYRIGRFSLNKGCKRLHLASALRCYAIWMRHMYKKKFDLKLGNCVGFENVYVCAAWLKIHT